LPDTRTEFWEAKVHDNQRRDHAAKEKLTMLGYRVVTLWECELKSKNSILSIVNTVTGRDEVGESI